jgi:hypothetical protein
MTGKNATNGWSNWQVFRLELSPQRTRADDATSNASRSLESQADFDLGQQRRRIEVRQIIP